MAEAFATHVSRNAGAQVAFPTLGGPPAPPGAICT